MTKDISKHMAYKVKDDPFFAEEAKQEKWLDENRPRSKYPYECGITGCKNRADKSFDIIYKEEVMHFCSKEHLLLPWRVKKETKIGRPKGAKNKSYRA